LFVLAFLGLLGAVWLALESPALDVDHVEVTGTRGVSVIEVVAAAEIVRGDALTFVDTEAVRDRVEALPRIASAKVTRSFPGTVHVEVTEREPVAWVSLPVREGAPPGSVVFVDARGRVIEEGESPAANLPEIRGLGSLPDVGERVDPVGAVTLLAELPPALRAQVSTVTMVKGEATLGLRPRPGGWPSAEAVRLGDLRDVRAKGLAALAVLGALEGSVGYLDVGVPTAPATGG
ncbi:MAG: cell division protein FtsQ/DivIB, partial [Acidimicrobiia bacterium]